MNQLFQAMLIVFSVAFSWLAMMIVHEFGHVLHAWFSGGTVSRVFLHPLTFSRTELSDNPHPLFVAWGGALWGCIIPLLLLVLGRLVNGGIPTCWHFSQAFA